MWKNSKARYMKKATELRIGNKIRYHNRENTIVCLHKNGIVFLSSGAQTHLKDIYPIELTHDLLIRSGFSEKDGIYKYMYRELTEIFSTFNEFFFRYDGKFIASCRYLHELQNIFFALYKEEIRVIRSSMPEKPHERHLSPQSA